MPKVLVSDSLSETAVQIFRDNNIDVDFLPKTRSILSHSANTMPAIARLKKNTTAKYKINCNNLSKEKIVKLVNRIITNNYVFVGYTKFANLPAEEKFAIYHPKDIGRQEKQNAFYDTI